MSAPLHIVILAAGEGTRMRSELPKVLHRVGGAPMIIHLLDAITASVGLTQEHPAQVLAAPDREAPIG
jgi:bifunctional UDP-N-acetylglucosamine pyrophosphorylase / glucosamine-1-phosphate N-acetyltransferase